MPRRGLPHRRSVERWLRASLEGPAAITVRFAGTAEVRELNGTFRGQRKPTNVLSFSYPEPPAADAARPHRRPRAGRRPRPAVIHGDIVLCPQVVHREARIQGKSAAAHYAHMVVHGALHLQGYDHDDDADAEIMESRERAI